MRKPAVHVTPRGGEGWSVRREGNQRATSIEPTQAAAEQVARQIARREHTELLIHGRDGRIRERDSYGNDPFPPEG